MFFVCAIVFLALIQPNLLNSCKDLNSHTNLILICLLNSMYLVPFVENFITLFLILELFSTIFFFFFLTSNVTNISLINYKYFLTLFLWNSFITTVIYCLGLAVLIYSCGTTSFIELVMFRGSADIGLILILISFFWKLGLPMFHYLKLELYKYLTDVQLFYYSVITLLVNSFLIIFLLNLEVMQYVVTLYSFGITITIFAFCIVAASQYTHNLGVFLSYSGLITLVVVTISLLIVTITI